MENYNEEQNGDVEESTKVNVSQWEPADLLDRPKWPKVVGVISILFASFGLTCGSVLAVFGVIMPSLVEGGLDGDPVPDGMVMHGIDYFYAGFGLALAALLLVAGITAVTYRPLTRILHLIYAAFTIPLTILNYLNQTAKQASIFEWAEQYPDNQISQNMDPNNIGSSVGQIIGLAFMIVLGFGIPAFYLIWFGLIKTKPEQITGGDEGVY